MKKMYILMIALVIFLFVGASLKVAFPENPNFNYIDLKVTSRVTDVSSSYTSITFYVNASYNCAFRISSNTSTSLQYSSFKTSGFYLYFANRTNSNGSESSFVYMPGATTPPINMTENNSHFVERMTLKSLAIGCYFYHLAPFKTYGEKKNIVKVNYVDPFFNLTNTRIVCFR